MGRFDFVEADPRRSRRRIFFTGAKIQPGKPVVFGRLPSRAANGWTYFFGLPGNPISTMVTFALFVHPVLNALAGDTSKVPRFRLAELVSPAAIKSGLTRFLPAFLADHDLPYGAVDCVARFRRSCEQCTGNLYVVVPPAREDGKDELPAGEIVSRAPDRLNRWASSHTTMIPATLTWSDVSERVPRGVKQSLRPLSRCRRRFSRPFLECQGQSAGGRPVCRNSGGEKDR